MARTNKAKKAATIDSVLELSESESADLLGTLFNETINELIRRVKSGNAAPADIANAIKLLRDNAITGGKDDEDSNINDLNKQILDIPYTFNFN